MKYVPPTPSSSTPAIPISTTEASSDSSTLWIVLGVVGFGIVIVAIGLGFVQSTYTNMLYYIFAEFGVGVDKRRRILKLQNWKEP